MTQEKTAIGDSDAAVDALVATLSSSLVKHPTESPQEAANRAAEHAKIFSATKKNEEEVNENDVRALINAMEFPDKVKAAQLGDARFRAILITDPNSMIAESVLQNPKISLREIEEFATNPSLSDRILRSIAANRDWMKSYNLKRSLCFNPKTPPTISVRLVKYMLINDLKKLSRSRGIPATVVVVAKKLVAEKSEK
jgi:hypothetical protein